MATANFQPLVIRVDDLDSQQQRVSLNGVTFFLQFSFSTAYTRDNWVMDVLDVNKDNLLVGRRLTSTTNMSNISLELTEQIGGSLFCVNTTGTRTPMNRDNFGTTKAYQIWYVSNAEVGSGTS